MPRTLVRRWGGRAYGAPPSNQIQNGTLQRRLAEVMQMKESSPAPTLASEIQPVIIVDDISTPQKQDAIRWCSDGLNALWPIAAPLAGYALFNPPLSGVIVELKAAMFSPATSLYTQSLVLGWGINPGPPVLAPNFTPEFRSKYNAGFPRARMYVGQANEVVTNMGASYVGNSVNVDLPVQGIVIPPGFYFVAVQQSLAAPQGSGIMNYVWTESDEAR